MLTSVFGYPTHKLKIHQDSKQQTPAEFVRSLFLRSSTTPTPNSPGASDEFANANISSYKPKAMHNRHSGSRNTSSVATRPKIQRQLVQRSFSYPIEAPVVPSITTASPSLPNSNLFTDQSRNQASSDDAESAKPDLQRPALRSLGIQTDPVPMLIRSSSSETMTLPRALVISGLENASLPSQRALLKVLSEKRVVLDESEGNLVYNLPQGFIVVYVCAADPRERPAIHKTLVSIYSD